MKCTLRVEFTKKNKFEYKNAFANVSLRFGCREVKMQFPVKLTEPVTAILYISPDKRHLDDLHHAIHVHEVGEGKLYNF